MPKRNLTVADFLERAKKLIETPKTWGKGDYYRDGKYCMMGALNATHKKLIQITIENEDKVLFERIGKLNRLAEEYLIDVISVKTKCKAIGILGFNDGRTTRHRSVMKVFDLAIKKAQKESLY